MPKPKNPKDLDVIDNGGSTEVKDKRLTIKAGTRVRLQNKTQHRVVWEAEEGAFTENGTLAIPLAKHGDKGDSQLTPAALAQDETQTEYPCRLYLPAGTASKPVKILTDPVVIIET